MLQPDALKDGIAVLRAADPPEAHGTEGGGPVALGKLKVAELRSALEARGVKAKSRSTKAQLCALLTEALTEPQASPGSQKSSTRAVGIPALIEHSFIPCRTASIEGKIQVRQARLFRSPMWKLRLQHRPFSRHHAPSLGRPS